MGLWVILTRLNKYLAESLGVSRREADDLIASNVVQVNGNTVGLGARVDDGAKITVRGKEVKGLEKYDYIAMNKPSGYVSSRRAQGDTPTLYELLPEELRGLKTVGRLDKDSSGIILLTNDGDFAFRMTHPSFEKMKIYEVELDRDLEPLHHQMIADYGVELTDGGSRLGLSRIDDGRRRWRVEMKEGRNRQIRRTFGALGYTVIGLHRITFGKYELGDLALGAWRRV